MISGFLIHLELWRHCEFVVKALKQFCFGQTIMGKFLRDSRNICTLKSFQIMNLKEGMTLNFILYIGFY